MANDGLQGSFRNTGPGEHYRSRGGIKRVSADWVLVRSVMTFISARTSDRSFVSLGTLAAVKVELEHAREPRLDDQLCSEVGGGLDNWSGFVR